MLTIQCVTSDVGMESGAGWGTRTPDLMITNQLLYQLSYAGTFFFIIKLDIYQDILKLNF